MPSVRAMVNFSASILANMGCNPGLAALWEDERQRRRDAGCDSQLEAGYSQGLCFTNCYVLLS